ncbi:MAG: hypothetical protein K5848_01185 [Lachnospiraceae bacterium]|nr:hypothetical protein [Lachnospiraceae bacterium]
MKRIISVIAVLSIVVVLAAVFFYDRSLKEEETETNVTEEVQTAELKNDTTGSEEAAVKNEEDGAAAEGSDDELSESEQAIINAHISLFSNFEQRPEGFVYPDDFCGEYQKGDRLHIVLMSKDEATISKYNEYVKNSEVVVYELGKHPLRTLESYRDDMWKKLKDNGIQPYGGYVDQFTGIIKLEVAEENVEGATAFLEELIAGGEYGDLSTEEVEVMRGDRSQTDTAAK